MTAREVDLRAAQVEGSVRRVAASASFGLPMPLREAMGQVLTLPAPADLLQEVKGRLLRSEVQPADVATVVRRAPAVACRLLQLGNAGNFESTGRLCDVDQAIGLVGLRRLAIMAEEGSLAIFLPAAFERELERTCRHAFAVGTVAKSIFRDPRAAEAAFSAGLLHSIGWLALAMASPATFAQRQAEPQLAHDGLIERLTGYVLHTWGLPAALVAATSEAHREPDEETFSPASAVFLARKLVALVANARCGPMVQEPPLTNRFVQRHRLAKELPSMVDRAASAVEAACRTTTPLPARP